MRALGAIAVAVAMMFVAGCGPGGRPSQKELSDGLQKSADAVLGENTPIKHLPKSIADCMAGVLVDSKVSDGALRALADGKKDFQPVEKDEKAFTAVVPKMTTCITDGLGDIAGVAPETDTKKGADKKGTGKKASDKKGADKKDTGKK